jgi:hypothetical protein
VELTATRSGSMATIGPTGNTIAMPSIGGVKAQSGSVGGVPLLRLAAQTVMLDTGWLSEVVARTSDFSSTMQCLFFRDENGLPGRLDFGGAALPTLATADPPLSSFNDRLVEFTIEVPARGVKPDTVRSTLTTFGMVIQSFVNQGALPRNVIALVERPADAIIDETSGTSKSWTLAEVERFRDSVRHDRLYACLEVDAAQAGLLTQALEFVGVPLASAIPASALCWPAACQCTSSRPGTATIRRCRCRSTPMPSAMTCSPPAPHCSPSPKLRVL